LELMGSPTREGFAEGKGQVRSKRKKESDFKGNARHDDEYIVAYAPRGNRHSLLHPTLSFLCIDIFPRFRERLSFCHLHLNMTWGRGDDFVCSSVFSLSEGELVMVGGAASKDL